MNKVIYSADADVSVEQFVQVLHESGLAERRPIDNVECLMGMLANANLTITAWVEEKLIGIARSVTDFHYACYLSDLAVSRSWQGVGIGTELVRFTENQLQSECKIILLAAPDAEAYYPHIGFERQHRCWVKSKA